MTAESAGTKGKHCATGCNFVFHIEEIPAFAGMTGFLEMIVLLGMTVFERIKKEERQDSMLCPSPVWVRGEFTFCDILRAIDGRFLGLISKCRANKQCLRLALTKSICLLTKCCKKCLFEPPHPYREGMCLKLTAGSAGTKGKHCLLIVAFCHTLKRFLAERE